MLPTFTEKLVAVTEKTPEPASTETTAVSLQDQQKTVKPYMPFAFPAMVLTEQETKLLMHQE